MRVSGRLSYVWILVAAASVTPARAQTSFSAGEGVTLPVAVQSQPADQASAPPAQSKSFGYARLGYGGLFGDHTYGMPGFGFGYRAALDSLGLDISFLNIQLNPDNAGTSNGGVAGSWLKLEALYFVKPKANASTYVGGGLSWGGVDFAGSSGSNNTSGTVVDRTNWHGSGLQGELTAGYEVLRATTMRVFVQADGVLPFYRTTSETYSFSRTTRATSVTTERRYAPSLVLSLGLGWSRGGRR